MSEYAIPELSWHRPKGATGRPTVKSAPQSPRRMRAQLEQGVERQSQGIGRGGVRRRSRQPELMDGPARAPHAMPAIVGTPQIKTGKMRQVDRRCRGRACGRRRRQQHGFGLQARNPEYQLSISRLQRVAWEIVTPSAVRRLPGLLRLETCGGSLVRNRDDSHHRDEDTPRRSLEAGITYRMLISRRRAPIDVEHAVTSHLATVRSTASEWRVLVARRYCLKTELSNTLIVVRDQVWQSYF